LQGPAARAAARLGAGSPSMLTPEEHSSCRVVNRFIDWISVIKHRSRPLYGATVKAIPVAIGHGVPSSDFTGEPKKLPSAQHPTRVGRAYARGGIRAEFCGDSRTLGMTGARSGWRSAGSLGGASRRAGAVADRPNSLRDHTSRCSAAG